MKSKLLGGVAALGLGCGLCGASYGATVAFDSFAYQASASVNGANGGSGWSNAWYNGSSGNAVTAGGLSYGNLDVAGNKLTTSGGDVKSLRTIAGSKLGNNGTEIWVGFLANLAAGSASSYGGVSLFNDSTEVLFMGDPSGATKWGFKRSGFGNNLSGATVDANTQLLVYRILFQPGAETVDMWVNPTLGTTPSNASRAASASVSDFRFNGVRIASGAGEQLNVDELRIGGSFADVAPVAVPSPTAAVAGAVGVVGVALRKWRRGR